MTRSRSPSTAAFSTYHGLQTKLERRFSAGLYLLNAFTWSKAMDNASGHLEVAGGDNSSVNYRNMAADKGLSSYNQPLNNTTTLIWEVPVGRQRRFASRLPAALDALAGGWRLSAINTMASGQPINVYYDVATAATVTYILTYRPNLLGDPMLPASQRTIDRYFNTASFQTPSASQPLGTAGRNIARGYPLYQMDFGLQKAFPIREAARVEFPQRVLQPAQQNQLPGAQQRPHQHRLRHHAQRLPGAPDPIRPEAPVLMGQGKHPMCVFPTIVL